MCRLSSTTFKCYHVCWGGERWPITAWNVCTVCIFIYAALTSPFISFSPQLSPQMPFRIIWLPLLSHTGRTANQLLSSCVFEVCVCAERKSDVKQLHVKQSKGLFMDISKAPLYFLCIFLHTIKPTINLNQQSHNHLIHYVTSLTWLTCLMAFTIIIYYCLTFCYYSFCAHFLLFFIYTNLNHYKLKLEPVQALLSCKFTQQ